MIPNFQETMYRMLSLRDQTLNNPHEFYIADSEADANTAGPILQTDGTNPRIDKVDRNMIEPLIGDRGPGQALLLDSEFWMVRFSLDGFTEDFFRKSQTFWIKFDGETRLTLARQVYRERLGNTKIQMTFEITERL